MCDSQSHSPLTWPQALDPELHAHLETMGAGGYFFAFRWLLVSFKREFGTVDLLRLWEICWTCPFTPHLPVFLAAAVLVENRRLILDEVGDDFDRASHT